MNNIGAKISAHAKDIIQKYTSGLFKDITLEFYGIKTAPIKELINVELPVVEVGETSTDFIFLLADNTYLHFEFQSSYNKDDLLRFATYDIRLFQRDRRVINTVVIYTSDVREIPTGFNIGSLAYNPDRILMYEYDGNKIYDELEAKIKAGNVLTDMDMLNLIFLPLMRNTMSRDKLAVNSIRLAQTITDKTKRNTCIASVFAFANKYLDENKLGELLEVLKMTDLATMFVEEGIQEGMQKGMQKGRHERAIEIAKDMLKDKEPIAKIIRYVKLDESTIIRLQEELNQE